MEREGGRIAYEVEGEGPLVVLAHGMGDSRRAYRFLASRLVAEGYRVASVDLRGHGDSTIGWPSYTRTDTAGDLVALIRHLGGPAVIVGHSFAGGSATIAAADAPELVSGIVEIGPFTRAQKFDIGGMIRNRRHGKGMLLLLAAGAFRGVGMWKRYLDHAYPGEKPKDWSTYLGTLETELRRPGRMAVVAKMGMNPPTDAGAKLPEVPVPALVVMGELDPDWADPKAEADGIVAALPAGSVAMIPGAGHYPHGQFPDRVAEVLLPYLAERTRG
ncbi:hydrolase [Acrocarpospora phusangensis]|uniref:Hydrolase n=1 Tax=Acrocarpospora phusangensis TaxID=1070424 RepID=A0A919QFY4_9ACTN|nr:hydrolase [Acrocarpospora phusangensis]